MVNHSQNSVFWPEKSKLTKLARVVAPPARVVAPLCSTFWVGSTGPNHVQDGSLERLVYLLSIPSGIYGFGVDLTPQKSILPRSLSATQKVGRKSIFWCILSFWRPKSQNQASPKYRLVYFLHALSKNVNFLQFWAILTSGHAGGETTPQAKTCKFPKNFQNAPKLSKFLDFAAGSRLMSTMVSEGCLSQDTEWICPFLPLLGLWQLPLENFHFCFANM